LDRIESLLYFLYEAKIVRGKTRLQKEVFLAQEAGIPFNYDFKPYDKGPLSFELIDDINSLKNGGFLMEAVVLTDYGPRYDYYLSEVGRRYVERFITKKISLRDKKKIISIIAKWNRSSLESLLNYVHRKWPEYKVQGF
jgi:uncharacterized protein YwgA